MNPTSQNSLKGSLLLLLTAVIWGSAFVAQSVGMEYVGPFTFNCTRCTIGGLALLPCIAFLDRWRAKKGEAKPKTWDKTLLVGGALCGVTFFVASSLQQVGILHTTVGKAGFITALYIVLVPIFGLFIGKRVGVRVWIGVAVAVAGLYLLCITEDFSIAKSDICVLLCAVGFAIQILLIDRYSPLVDGVRLACVEFWICALCSGIAMLLFEQPTLSSIRAAWMPIGYAGVFSCGIAYTLQIIGQKELNPTVASLIMSLESVVSVLAGWLLLGQVLSTRELWGCLLMCVAIVLAQI